MLKRWDPHPWLCQARTPLALSEFLLLQADTKVSLIEELKKVKDKHTITWIEALGAGDSGFKVLEILFMRREAIKAGPGSVEWNAARVIWGYVGDRVKDECFEVSRIRDHATLRHSAGWESWRASPHTPTHRCADSSTRRSEQRTFPPESREP